MLRVLLLPLSLAAMLIADWLELRSLSRFFQGWLPPAFPTPPCQFQTPPPQARTFGELIERLGLSMDSGDPLIDPAIESRPFWQRTYSHCVRASGVHAGRRVQLVHDITIENSGPSRHQHHARRNCHLAVATTARAQLDVVAGWHAEQLERELDVPAAPCGVPAIDAWLALKCDDPSLPPKITEPLLDVASTGAGHVLVAGGWVILSESYRSYDIARVGELALPSMIRLAEHLEALEAARRAS